MPPDKNIETPMHLKLRREKELREGLLKEVDRLLGAEIKVVMAKFQATSNEAAEAKKISLSARKHASKPHACQQVDELRSIKKSVGSWTSWWRGIGIAILTLTIVTAGGAATWWHSHAEVKTKVEFLSGEMTEVKATVKTTKESFDAFQNDFEKQQATQLLRDERAAAVQLERIAETVRSTVKSEIRRTRR